MYLDERRSLISKGRDHVYDESGIPDLVFAKLNMFDWLDVTADQCLELI